jgi:hypothetical protein
MTQTPIDYDSPWKLMLESYFREFVSFFSPQIHDQIDWERQYESLDKELQQVVRDGFFKVFLSSASFCRAYFFIASVND